MKTFGIGELKIIIINRNEACAAMCALMDQLENKKNETLDGKTVGQLEMLREEIKELDRYAHRFCQATI